MFPFFSVRFNQLPEYQSHKQISKLEYILTYTNSFYQKLTKIGGNVNTNKILHNYNILQIKQQNSKS